MKRLTELYQEIENLKTHNLVCDVKYRLSHVKRANLPYNYFETITITFPSSIDKEKILDVKDYIEHAYVKNGGGVEHVCLKSSHMIELCVVKSESTMRLS